MHRSRYDYTWIFAIISSIIFSLAITVQFWQQTPDASAWMIVVFAIIVYVTYWVAAAMVALIAMIISLVLF